MTLILLMLAGLAAGQAWKDATPESQGVDSVALAKVFELARDKHLNVHSVLVIRHGRVVLDVGFYPYKQGTPHDGASVTKSVTSALVGIALGDGVLKTIDQPVAGKITVKDLVSMSSGLECGFKPGEQELAQMKLSPDWVRFALALEPKYEPGQRFGYCSPGFHLLSYTLSNAAGMSTLDYARKHLLDPLGIKEAVWPTDPQGRNTGWGNLHLLPRDFAKIGYLYLHEGVWEGKQVIPKAWVRESITQKVEARKDTGYGYGWWIYDKRQPRMFEANGRGGQRVSVIPEKDAIVVFTAGGLDPSGMLTLVVNAMSSEAPLPENAAALSALREKIKHAEDPPATDRSTVLSGQAKLVSGRKFLMEPNLMDLKSIALAFEGGKEASARMQVAQYPEMRLRIGLDGKDRFSPDGHLRLPACARGWWESDNEFVLDLNTIANINHYRMSLKFTGDLVYVTINEATGQYKNLQVTGHAGR